MKTAFVDPLLDAAATKDAWIRRIEHIRQYLGIVERVECGPVTYGTLEAILMAEQDLSNVERIRSGLMNGRLELSLADATFVLRQDVPDGTLWPPREVSPYATMRRLDRDLADETTSV